MKLQALSRLRIKRSKNAYRSLLVIIFLTFFFTTAGQCIQTSVQETERQHRFSLYGEWQGAVYNATQTTVNTLENHKVINRLGLVRSFATGRSLNGYGSCQLGTMDQEAMNLGHLQLVEGKLPQGIGEIAVERAALSAMGISYDIGQEINLEVQYEASQGELVQEKKTYLLTGTLQSFSANWMESAVKQVNAVVAESDSICKMALSQNTVLFFGEHINEESLLELEPILSEEEKLQFNNKAYPSPKKAFQEIVQENLISLTLLLGCVSFVFYAASITLRSQRYGLQLMSVLGAGRGQIRQLICWDFAYILTISAAPGILLGILLVYSFIEGQVFGFNDTLVFYVQPIPLMLWCVFICMIVFMALLWPIVQLKVTVSASPEQQKNIESFKLNPIRQKYFNRDFSRRIYLAEKRTYVFWTLLISVLSFSVLTAAINISDNWKNYTQQETYGFWSYAWGFQPGDGFSQEEVRRLEMVEALETVDAILSVNQLSADWDGCEKSKYRAHMYKDGIGSRHLGFTVALDSDSKLFQYYAMEADEGSISAEELDQGKCIVLLTGILPGGEGGYNSGIYNGTEWADDVLMHENTLSLGDNIHVGNEIGSFQAEVAAIVRNVPNRPEYHSLLRITGAPLSVVVSKSYFEKCINQEYLYNDVAAFGDLKEISPTTDKEVSRFSGKGPVSFYNFRESFEMEKKNRIEEISLMGLFAVIVVFLGGMMLFQNVLRQDAEKERDTILLCELGMDVAQCNSIYGRIRRNVVCAGILLSLIPIFVLFFYLPFEEILHEDRWNFGFVTTFNMWMKLMGSRYLVLIVAIGALLALYFWIIISLAKKKQLFN